MRRLSVAIATVLGLLLGLEVLCRVLPVSTATHVGYHIDADILTYPPHFEWRVATGWDLRNAQRLRSNNLGFAAERDFVQDRTAVALVGDSYVEASMLHATQRPGPQLETALHGRPVYAMGGPGSSLLDYADRVRLARQRLGVQDIVIMVERGDVRQAVCGSANVHSACLAPGSFAPSRVRQASPSAAKQMLRHSALAQYLVSQLKLRPEMLRPRWPIPAATSEQGPPRAEGVPGLGEEGTNAVVQTFLARMGPISAPARVVLVVDGRHHPDKEAMDPAIQAERHALMKAARDAGYRVVDAEPLYRAHHQRSLRSLNVGPYDGHLNGLGIQLVMQAAAAALQPDR